MAQPAVFLDRDGVINVDSGYVSSWSAFEFLPGAIEAMRDLCQSGYALVIVTNQSGIARGYYSEADFLTLTQTMRGHLETQGVSLAGVYYCPHLADAAVSEYGLECECRKPLPGMIFKAVSELTLDLTKSAMVGDKVSDMQAAHAAGIETCFHVTQGETAPGCISVTDLASATAKLLKPN